MWKAKEVGEGHVKTTCWSVWEWVPSTEKWETLLGHGRVVREVRWEVGVTLRYEKVFKTLINVYLEPIWIWKIIFEEKKLDNSNKAHVPKLGLEMHTRWFRGPGTYRD